MRIIKEAKNIGILYHVCTLSDFVEYIVPNDCLEASGNYLNKLKNRTDIISFTRDRFYSIHTIKNLSSSSKIILQICVDGNLLSERYKVFPYNDFVGTGKGEAEECVISPITNFKRYINEIHFDFFKYEINPSDGVLIQKALQYYNNITYFHFNRNLKQNPYNINTGDSLSSLLELDIPITTIDKVFLDYVLYGKTRQEDGWLLEYVDSKDQYDVIKQLVKSYNIDTSKKLVKNGKSIMTWLYYYLLQSNNSKTSDRIIETINNLEKIGFSPLCQSDKKEAENMIHHQKKLNKNLASLGSLLFDKSSKKQVDDFIRNNKEDIKPQVYGFVKNYILDRQYYSREILQTFLKNFPDILVNIDLVKNIPEDLYKDTIGLFIDNGLFNEDMLEVLRLLYYKKDFENILYLLKQKNIDPFDDKYFDLIMLIYDDAIKNKKYELVDLLLSLGLWKRLNYSKPKEDFLNLSRGDNKLFSIANKYINLRDVGKNEMAHRKP